MEVSKVVGITGTILGGGGLTGLAIKYFPYGSEETSQQQIKPRPKKVNRKITQQEITDFGTKSAQWTSKNGNCTLQLIIGGIAKDSNSISEGEETDLEGLEQALESDDAKSKCKSGRLVNANKGEDGSWVFQGQAEIFRNDILQWTMKNGGCKIQIKDGETTKSLEEFNNGGDLESISDKLTTSKELESENKQKCEQKINGKTAVFLFEKQTGDVDEWKFTTN